MSTTPPNDGDGSPELCGGTAPGTPTPPGAPRTPSPGTPLPDVSGPPAAPSSLAHRVALGFEAAWRAAPPPPSIAGFLPPPGPDRAAVLLELCLIDLQRRQALGLPAEPSQYLRHFPELAAVPGAADELVRAAAGVNPPGYQVLGEIARGGMGRVLAARDRAFGRDVAVKVLLGPGRAASAWAARFVREAVITARLQHPGIPPVHAMGEMPDGSPFLAMKLIRGQTLAALLSARATPADDLPRFIGVFEQLCQAVAYAHSKGVIHRDLKPSNVMVGAFGEVQVMDWGLAKEVGDPAPEGGGGAPDPSGAPHHDQTRPGTVLGTPGYMPPEQARGEPADRRADVFGLGGILCATLTGSPPFAGSSRAEVAARTAAGDVADAFARLDGCAADRELIALAKRCLAADPTGRPADAGEVAEAVRALRAGSEERVRRAELDRRAAEVRAAELRKRQRAQLGLAAAVLVIAVGGGVGAWVVQKQISDRERAEGEKRLVEAREDANSRAARARNADAIRFHLERCEGALRDDDAGAARTALAEIDRRLPDGGGEELADRATRCRTNLSTLTLLDRLDDHLWALTGSNRLRSHRQVAADLTAAFAGIGIVPGRTPHDLAADRIAASLVAGRLLEALDLWLVLAPTAEVRDLLAAADPHPFRDRLRAAVADQSWWRLMGLAADSGAAGQPARFAVVMGTQDGVPTILRRRILDGARPARPDRYRVFMARASLANAKGLREVGEVVRWAQAAAAVRPDNPIPLLALGTALVERGEAGAALDVLRRAADLAPDYPVGHMVLGEALRRTRQYDEAERHLRLALDLRPDEGYFHYHLGVLYDETGRPEAVAEFRSADRLRPRDAGIMTGLGVALVKRGETQEGVKYLRGAIELDPAHAPAHYSLGVALRLAREWEAAAASFREAIRLRPGDVDAHLNLGNVRIELRDFDGAIESFREAIRLDPANANAHRNLGIVLAHQQRWGDAAAAFRESLRFDPDNAEVWFNLGHASGNSQDLDGAVEAFDRAIRLQPGNAVFHQFLGHALKGKKKYPAAAAAYRVALRLEPENASLWASLGITLYHLADFAGSVAAYQQAVRLKPGDAAMRKNLQSAKNRLAVQEAHTAPPPRPVGRR